MGKIYLIRHGQTDSNAQKRFQGKLDIPLNETGRKQAEKLAAYYDAVPLDAVYCSSLQRAQATALPLAQKKSLNLTPLASLREVCFGQWEGLTYDDIYERWPQQMDNFLMRPSQCVPPEGETFAQAQLRVKQALDAIIAEQGHKKNIAVVSHGGVIRLLVCALLDIPIDSLWKISVHNVSSTCFSDWNGNFCLEYLNDAHYLAE